MPLGIYGPRSSGMRPSPGIRPKGPGLKQPRPKPKVSKRRNPGAAMMGGGY